MDQQGPFSQFLKPQQMPTNPAAEAGFGGVFSTFTNAAQQFLAGAQQARAQKFFQAEAERQRNLNALQTIMKATEDMKIDPQRKSEFQMKIGTMLASQLANMDDGAKGKGQPQNPVMAFVKNAAQSLVGPSAQKVQALGPDTIGQLYMEMKDLQDNYGIDKLLQQGVTQFGQATQNAENMIDVGGTKMLDGGKVFSDPNAVSALALFDRLGVKPSAVAHMEQNILPPTQAANIRVQQSALNNLRTALNPTPATQPPPGAAAPQDGATAQPGSGAAHHRVDMTNLQHWAKQAGVPMTQKVAIKRNGERIYGYEVQGQFITDQGEVVNPSASGYTVMPLSESGAFTQKATPEEVEKVFNQLQAAIGGNKESGVSARYVAALNAAKSDYKDPIAAMRDVYNRYNTDMSSRDRQQISITNRTQSDLTPYQRQAIRSKLANDWQQFAKTDFGVVQNQYRAMEGLAKDPTGASDTAFIKAFMRITDPRTGVRDAEYKVGEEMGGLIRHWRFLLEGGKLEGVRLDPKTRAETLRAARTILDSYIRDRDELVGMIELGAADAGVTPDRIIPGYARIKQEMGGGEQSPTQRRQPPVPKDPSLTGASTSTPPRQGLKVK